MPDLLCLLPVKMHRVIYFYEYTCKNYQQCAIEGVFIFNSVNLREGVSISTPCSVCIKQSMYTIISLNLHTVVTDGESSTPRITDTGRRWLPASGSLWLPHLWYMELVTPLVSDMGSRYHNIFFFYSLYRQYLKSISDYTQLHEFEAKIGKALLVVKGTCADQIYT
jgi:hypothetical protein